MRGRAGRYRQAHSEREREREKERKPKSSSLLSGRENMLTKHYPSRRRLENGIQKGAPIKKEFHIPQIKSRLTSSPFRSISRRAFPKIRFPSMVKFVYTQPTANRPLLLSSFTLSAMNLFPYLRPPRLPPSLPSFLPQLPLSCCHKKSNTPETIRRARGESNPEIISD